MVFSAVWWRGGLIEKLLGQKEEKPFVALPFDRKTFPAI